MRVEFSLGRVLAALAVPAAFCFLFVPSRRPLVLAASGAPAAPAVWLVSSLERVGPNDPPGQEQDVRLAAARGETESFQIVVRPPDNNAADLTVTISDLIGPGGQRISNRQVQLYCERYVYIDSKQGSPDWHGSNRPLGPGWYPDALLPFTETTTLSPAARSATLQQVCTAVTRGDHAGGRRPGARSSSL